MDELFENSVLQDMYEQRNEVLNHVIIRNSKEYKEHESAMENKLRELLNYVPGEHYKQLENEIEDFLFDHIGFMSEFWCEKYYKLGFADGLNVRKEIAVTLEGLDNGKSIK